MRRICTLIMFFLVVFSNVAQGEKVGPEISVGLVVNQFSAEVSTDKGTVLTILSNGKSAPLDSKTIYASIKDGRLHWANEAIAGNEVEISTKNEMTAVSVNRKKYHGKIRISMNKDKRTLTVCNILPLEQYLYGVVAKEVIPLWPEEAIKAQAVAARSFALSAILKNSSGLFDIRANELGQVYGGIEAENPLTTKQVDATRGIVITHNGKPIEAYFHSAGGGFTENSENVWGTVMPYLKGVVDFDQDSPKYNWQKIYSIVEVETSLSNAGYMIGKLKAVRLSPLSLPPVKNTDRGISGRVIKLSFIGHDGEVSLTGNEMRRIFQLNSTLFDIFVGSQPPKSIEVTLLDPYGNEKGSKEIPINLPGDQDSVHIKGLENLRLITGSNSEKFVINGRGWGHGLGLSQWGTRGMALKAPKGSSNYFKEILRHYYTDVNIEKFY